MSFNNSKAVEIYAKKNRLFPSEEAIFSKYLVEPMTVLDLGCGTGRTTRPLADMGHRVTGVDVAPLMIEKARHMHPQIEFSVMDATRLRFCDALFDCVVFSFNGLDCLYPLAERLRALREIRRVLKPGGLLVYSSHKVESLLSYRALRRIRLYEYPYFRERTVYGDLVLFYGTLGGNTRQLKATGFTVLETVDIDERSWRYYVCVKEGDE